MTAYIEASQILDKTPVGMTVYDMAIGELTYANQSAEDILGIAKDGFTLEALHQVSRIIDQDGEVIPPEKYAVRLAADAKTSHNHVIGVNYHDGRIVWLNVQAVYGEEGGREIVVASFSDITSIIEAQRKEYEFIQNVSHELRTPLAIIYGYLDLLNSGSMGKFSSEVSSLLGRMRNKAETLRLLVERSLGVLTAEQKVSDQFAPVDIGELVQDTLADFQILLRDIEKKLAVFWEGELPAGTAVKGNRRLLWLVLNNLLTNAAKFTPDRGTVKISYFSEDDQVIIRISDNGIGIPTSKLERVFERFYQVDGSATRRYGGTGIGLHFAREVIRQHGGDITAESQPGHGSVFTIRLPLWTNS